MRIDRRDLVLGGIAAAVSGGAVLARRPARAPAATAAAFESALPDRIVGYRAVPETGFVLPDRDQLSERIYDSFAVRGYRADASSLPPIRVVAAYGSVQDYGLQLHRPESCYPAAGYRIGNRRVVTLDLGEGVVQAVALTASRRNQREQVLYWTRIGDAFPTDLWAERRLILSHALSRDLADGAIVRMSVFSNDPQAATAQLAGFAKGFCRALGAAARLTVLGRA